MKALVYEGPQRLEYRDEPEPPDSAEIRVKVAASGICGSDMHAYLGHDERRPAPLILGHEAVGVALGGALSGRRVAINPLVTCGTCNACLGGRSNLCAHRQIISMMPRPGAFADYVTVPETNLVEVPDGTPDAIAALTEPMAVSYHAINCAERHAAVPLSAQSAVVIGGGAIGMCAAHVLMSRGCRNIAIAETSPLRRERIATAAMFDIYAPDTPAESAAGTIDVVVDAYGGEKSRATSSMLAKPGGAIVHIGLASGEGGLDIRRLTLQEIAFFGTYTYTMVEFRETLSGLGSGLFGPIDWIEQRHMSDGPEAFRDLHAGKVNAAKIVLCNQ